MKLYGQLGYGGWMTLSPPLIYIIQLFEWHCRKLYTNFYAFFLPLRLADTSHSPARATEVGG